MNLFAARSVMLCGWLLASAALQAHHSLAAMFEIRQEGTVTGVLKKVAFTNPHGTMYLDVTAADGTVTEWVMTTGSANALMELGFGEGGVNYVAAGDVVTVRYIPARNAMTWGFIKSITLPNDNTVEFEGL